MVAAVHVFTVATWVALTTQQASAEITQLIYTVACHGVAWYFHEEPDP